MKHFKPRLDQLKPWFITTPIFYVNAAPHVGHLHSMVLADVLNRWQLFRYSSPTFFSTGTDEHGQKIQRAAIAQNLEPVDLCKQNSDRFRVSHKHSCH